MSIFPLYDIKLNNNKKVRGFNNIFSRIFKILQKSKILESNFCNFERPLIFPEMEFKEFEPRFKSAKTRFKLSAGLNL